MTDRDQAPWSHAYAKSEPIIPCIEISPSHIWKRCTMMGHGMAAEALQSTKQDKVIYRFHAPTHLLVAYEKVERCAGETFVEGLPPSTLHNLARKMTFVPAGHKYHECHEPRTNSDLMHFYFDPATLSMHSKSAFADIPLTPRLLFEDSALWLTVAKLKSLVESESSGDQIYFEALGRLLVCELIRNIRGTPSIQSQVRGGLAAWQQRALTTYIDQHISERIPLTNLAHLVDLSLYHFCRAFKQTFGKPPHRYQTKCRIEQAKVLLAKPAVSVTQVGLTVGFGSPTEFARVFRKSTGLTPSAFHRSCAVVTSSSLARSSVLRWPKNGVRSTKSCQPTSG